MLDIKDEKILILAGKNELAEDSEKQWLASALFYLLFSVDFSLEEMAAYLASNLKITEEEAKSILLDGSYLYFDQLNLEKKKEVESWFEQFGFNKENAKEELTAEKAGLISVGDLYYAEAEGVSHEIVDLFTQHLPLILSLKDKENQQELNDRLMFLLLAWENAPIFKEKLLQAINQNPDLLSKKKLKINKQEVNPTAANWLRDFEANNVLEKDLTIGKKVGYFNNSDNFKNLVEEEKITISDFLDLYWRLKFFPQNVPNQNFDDWYIVPFHQAENKIKQNIGEVGQGAIDKQTDSSQAKNFTKLYQQILDSLISKYKITENIVIWENKTPLELINALETSSRGEIILPVLVTLVKNNKDLTVLTTNTALARSLALTSPNLTMIFQALLKRAGLTTEEAAVFAIRLSQDNKSLSGLAYGDLKSGAFHWR